MGRGKFLLAPPYSCPGLLAVSHDFINLQFDSKLPGEGVMKVQCGNNDHGSQDWSRLTMYQALHKVLNSDFILYFPQAYEGGPVIIPCMQVRKPKLSVVKSRPRDNDARIAEWTCSAGSWLWTLILGWWALGCHKSPETRGLHSALISARKWVVSLQIPGCMWSFQAVCESHLYSFS